MAIAQNLAQILAAKYGKDVRQAIHDGIEECYTDVSTAKTLADEAAERANLSGFNPRGDYNPGAIPPYSIPDLVYDNGGSFRYINPVPSNAPTSSTSHWQQIASQGLKGDTGDVTPEAEAARDTAIAKAAEAQAYAAQLAAGTASPSGTYANLAALNSGTPTASNVAKIYITLDDGKWCYWNGSAWVAGGVYQATGIADGAVTSAKTDFIVQSGGVDLNIFDATGATDGYQFAVDGNAYALAGKSYTVPLTVKPSTLYSALPDVTGIAGVGYIAMLYQIVYMNGITPISQNTTAKVDGSFTTPATCDNIIVTYITTGAAHVSIFEGVWTNTDMYYYTMAARSYHIADLDLNDTVDELGQVVDPQTLDYAKEVAPFYAANAAKAFVTATRIGDFSSAILPWATGSNALKWVGGVMAGNGKIYGIPNGATQVLEIDPENGRYCLFGDLATMTFKWSGGCLYDDGCIYGFLRSSNKLLKIDPRTQTATEIDLGYKSPWVGYDRYYTGALVGDWMYLAPRAASNIMAINLDTLAVEYIGESIIAATSITYTNLAAESVTTHYKYVGAVRHYNGKVYFLPECGKVMVFDPALKASAGDDYGISFIGADLVPYCFNAVIADDGIMYGMSGTGSIVGNQGVLKIDPADDSVTMLTDTTITGVYGVKRGPNGIIYGIPGDTANIYALDTSDDSVEIAQTLDGGAYVEAKCAGGVMAQDGTIWCIPAKGTSIIKMVFDAITHTLPIRALSSVYFCNY